MIPAVRKHSRMERLAMDSTQFTPESQRPIVLTLLCPHCGQAYSRPFPAPFDQQFSTLVDWLLALEDAARQARRAAEEVAL